MQHAPTCTSMLSRNRQKGRGAGWVQREEALQSHPGVQDAPLASESECVHACQCRIHSRQNLVGGRKEFDTVREEEARACLLTRLGALVAWQCLRRMLPGMIILEQISFYDDEKVLCTMCRSLNLEMHDRKKNSKCKSKQLIRSRRNS